MNFEGLRYCSELDSLDISRNQNIVDLTLIPDLDNLSKLTAQYCRIKNLKFIHSKFPSLNIANFRNNDIILYEDVEHIKKIEYLGKYCSNYPLFLFSLLTYHFS